MDGVPGDGEFEEDKEELVFMSTASWFPELLLDIFNGSIGADVYKSISIISHTESTNQDTYEIIPGRIESKIANSPSSRVVSFANMDSMEKISREYPQDPDSRTI